MRPLSRRVRVFPADDHCNGWTATLPVRSPRAMPAGELHSDCVVVGAGYTGLAIARRLAEIRPEWRVVVVDAQCVGEGASGRSSGFLVEAGEVPPNVGPKGRDCLRAVARRGIDDLRVLVHRHHIDCAWDDTGWMYAAVSETGYRHLERLTTRYREAGIAIELLDADAIAATTGMRFYHRGLRVPGAPVIQPAALVCGLADSLPADIELFERAPVSDIKGGPPYRLSMRRAESTVVAERVFLATNGYTPGFGWLGDRILPVTTFGSLTRTLNAAEQDSIGGAREWGLLGTEPMGASLRRTRDQRILIRHAIHYARTPVVPAVTRARVAEVHHRILAARFSALADVELEFTWGGLLGATRRAHLSFGELAKGIYAVGGYNGTGIALGTGAGRLLADLAAGENSSLLRDLRAMPLPPWIPFEPFRSMGGRLYIGKLNHQGRALL